MERWPVVLTLKSFNEARLLPPGTGLARVNELGSELAASMRPGFFRREQGSEMPSVTRTVYASMRPGFFRREQGLHLGAKCVDLFELQ